MGKRRWRWWGKRKKNKRKKKNVREGEYLEVQVKRERKDGGGKIEREGKVNEKVDGEDEREAEMEENYRKKGERQ